MPAHLEVNLKSAEALQFKRLLLSLQAANVRLNQGTGPHIRSGADIIRWLIEQLPAVPVA